MKRFEAYPLKNAFGKERVSLGNFPLDCIFSCINDRNSLGSVIFVGTSEVDVDGAKSNETFKQIPACFDRSP